jgi:hypothetical protein
LRRLIVELIDGRAISARHEVPNCSFFPWH